MDKSKNNSPFPFLLMVMGLVGVVSFFLLSPRSTDFRWFPFVIVSSTFILAISIGWYIRKKFPPLKRSTQLLVGIIAWAFLLGVHGYGYQLAIERSTFNYRSFYIGFIFAALISLFEQYIKERKTASILPNNNKEVL